MYIVGAPGPLYKGIKDLISVLELEDCIEIVGKGNGLSFENILSYYKVADVFILPSVNIEDGDADGIPNVLIEAAFLGVPIVTTDAGSITEFISGGKEGVLVKQRNSKDLARGIERMLTNNKLRKKTVENAHKKAVEMFDIDINIKEIEKLLLS